MSLSCKIQEARLCACLYEHHSIFLHGTIPGVQRKGLGRVENFRHGGATNLLCFLFTFLSGHLPSVGQISPAMNRLKQEQKTVSQVSKPATKKWVNQKENVLPSKHKGNGDWATDCGVGRSSDRKTTDWKASISTSKTMTGAVLLPTRMMTTSLPLSLLTSCRQGLKPQLTIPWNILQWWQISWGTSDYLIYNHHKKRRKDRKSTQNQWRILKRRIRNQDWKRKALWWRQQFYHQILSWTCRYFSHWNFCPRLALVLLVYK